MPENLTPLSLDATLAAQYTAALERFRAELTARWGATATDADQALYLMLIHGPTPYGYLRIVLGAHAPTVARLAQQIGVAVVPVQADGQPGIALPPDTGAIRAAWPGLAMF